MKIEITNLTHQYPSGDNALSEINTVFEGTEPIAIIGQNGAGKTTFVKHLNGLLRPTTGDVLINGESIKNHTTAFWSRKIGYVFQNPDNQLFLESVKKEFEFGPKQQGIPQKEINERLKKVADLVGLADKLSIHPFDLNGTEKKFCTIGSILMMNPEMIILDEPTCGQDLEGNKRLERIITALKENHQLCITITHDMKFVVKNFDQIIVMAKGRIVKRATKEVIFSSREILQASSVSPPPITRVGQALGLEKPVFTQQDFHQQFENKKTGNTYI
ncbi:energy-coupling factor ABC transporter ATP-binding protein [Enterococcus pallens]|uniref:ABC transporter domain-containing protein n=1 Tax=Enterococcus pallens ATCC BAA-351 TaxID=1158607 RepID=R2T2P3_9ENTE|nr:ATP-binding cassette domain-containing protein [Enterococcus pallens]EOH94499.1 hypothetical protein UAU_02234 [Enterococcus pallens ATCC BAA-351]EOU24378.1 hypothetical protein I588_00365 [Enterococcus pallens ATCC BAA-351]